MRRIREMIEKVAPTDARVLITGPNGSGKELVARNLHQLSKRSAMPMIEVNCAAIPGELIESELFGHEKGSFTSAIKQHKGKFEQADGCTLFLDEIGDMSLAAQAKVLRVLQERKLSRVGSDKDIEVDVRVIAATNKNLEQEIEKGNFREDLYHRLSVIPIRVPSLDERKDDIPLLIDFFLKKYNDQNNSRSFSKEAVELLMQRSWPGNIRELENLVENIVVLEPDDVMRAKHLQARYCKGHIQSGSVTVEGILPYKVALEQMERQLLENTKNQFGSTRKIAAVLGVNQSTVSRKLRQYHLDDADVHHEEKS